MKVRTTNIKKAKTPAQPEMPTSVFLKKEMVEAAQKAVVYNLPEEFKAASKNRGAWLYISLLAFGVILLGATFRLTSYIESRNRSITVSIRDFEDINMQELLYSLRNAGKLIADMRSNMTKMKGVMNLEMQKIRNNSLEELEALKKRHNLSDAQREAMTKEILAKRERQITSLDSEYKAELINREKAMADMKQRMADEQAQLQQKMNTYVGQLENKLREFQADSKMSRLNAQQLVEQMSRDYAMKRRDEKLEYEKKTAEQKKEYEKKMQAEKNDYEAKLRNFREKIKEVEDSLKASGIKNSELESMLLLYHRTLTHYAFMKGEQGHVISTQKDGKLLLVLNPLFELEKSCKGIVIDKKGAVIANIEMTPNEGLVKATVTKKISNVPVSPFDMVIVQKE